MKKFFPNNILTYNKGQSLWEVLVALMIVIIVLAGVIKATVGSVRNINFSKEESKARDLGQMKMAEIVKLAGSEPGFWTGSAAYYVGLDKTEVVNNNLNCYRIFISSSENDVALIRVVIYWEQSSAGSGDRCSDYYYSKNLEFNTKVRNRFKSL